VLGSIFNASEVILQNYPLDFKTDIPFVFQESLGAHVANESEDPNMFVFITQGGSLSTGAAWGGTVCTPNDANINNGFNNGKGFRMSINSYKYSEKQLAKVK
jgi:hypothetical protein